MHAPVYPDVRASPNTVACTVNGVEMSYATRSKLMSDSQACEWCGYHVCSCDDAPAILAGFSIVACNAALNGSAIYNSDTKQIYLSPREFINPELKRKALNKIAKHYAEQLELKATVQRMADNSAKSNADKQRVAMMAMMAQTAQEAAQAQGYARQPPVRIPAATLSAFAEFVPKNPPPAPELKVSASATADFIWSDNLKAYIPVKANP